MSRLNAGRKNLILVVIGFADTVALNLYMSQASILLVGRTS